MELQEQFRAFQTKRNEIHSRQETLMKRAGDEGRTLDKEESEEYDSLSTELQHIDDHLGRLRVLVDENVPAKGAEPKGKGPTIIVRQQDKDDEFEGQAFVRRVIAKAVAQMEGYERSPAQIADHRWGKTNPTLVRVIKAAVAGGGELSGEWGAELVAADGRFTGDFIEFLHGMTVFDRLGLREVPANVTIKGQDGSATGYWTGEGKAIKVSAQDYSTVNLSPLKVGAISVVTNELLRDSSPAAERLVRDALVEASAKRIDETFLSTSAAVSNVSPAGILVSGTASVNSNGTTAAALRQDIRELYSTFLTAKNATGLTLVMTPTLAKSISLMVNALGQTEFPGINAGGGTLLGDRVITGDHVGATHMILVKPSDIYKIGDGGVEVSLSRDATIEQADDPTGDTLAGTAQTNNMTSMFQSESTAFKVVRSVNFAKRRTTAVSYVVDAGYGDADATTA